MLQCICDLWDAADSPEKKQLLLKELEVLVERLKVSQESSVFASAETVAQSEKQTANALPDISVQGRETLSVILGSTGLLEKYEQQLTPERRAEEFGKIRDAIQRFARLLDEATI